MWGKADAMDSSHGRSGRPSILAIVYTDGAAACRLMSDLGRRLRDARVMVTGLVPYQAAADDGTPRCDMEVEELSSHFILQLAEDRGKQPHGCRVDPEAVQEAAALIAASFRNAPELLIVNKFGQLEAEGGGLSDVISDAVDQGIPVIVAYPSGIWRAGAASPAASPKRPRWTRHASSNGWPAAVSASGAARWAHSTCSTRPLEATADREVLGSLMIEAVRLPRCFRSLSVALHRITCGTWFETALRASSHYEVARAASRHSHNRRTNPETSMPGSSPGIV